MRRILLLAYHFPPIGGSCVQRNARLARDLPAFGYETLAVTGSGTGGAERWTPVDDVLAGLLPPDLEVFRVAGPEPPPTSGVRGRAERWLDRTPPHARWWVQGAVAAGTALRGRVDLIHASLEPYTTAAAAARLAGTVGVPWVADLQDPWALDEMWISPTSLHRRREYARMRSLLASAAAIVMNTPEAARRLRARFPELGRTPVVAITNGFDARDFAGPPPRRDDDAFRIVHTGNLHTEFGLRLRRTARAKRLLGGTEGKVDVLTRSPVFVLDAVERLLARRPELSDRLELHFAGALTAGDRAVLERSPNVRLHGYLTHDRTVALIRSADLLFLPMHDLPPGERTTIVPMKTYEYLASGRPILAAVPDGDARDLLARAGGALLCRPSDSEAMAAAIELAVAEPMPGPERSVLAEYERVRIAAQVAELYDRLLAVPEHRGSRALAPA